MELIGYIFFFWFLLGVFTFVVICIRTDADMWLSDIEEFLFDEDALGFVFRLITLYFILPLALFKLLQK